MPVTELAIALGSKIVDAIGQKILDSPSGKGLARAKENLEKKFKLGKYGVIQRCLEGARDDLLAKCETDEQQQIVNQILDKLLGSKQDASLDEFTQQMTQVYLLPSLEISPTQTLPELSQLDTGPYVQMKSLVSDDPALTNILAMFFSAFRNRLLLEPDFANLREYFKLAESQSQTHLLKDISACLAAIKANTAKPTEDINTAQQEYLDFLVRKYKDHVIRGFSPRVSGRDVSLPLEKIFLPLQAIEGRPAVAEYAEEDLGRQFISSGMGDLDWQRQSLEMEKRSAQLDARQIAQRPLNLADLLENSRAVLLGDPGSGKTTVTHYITHAIAKKDYTYVGNKVIDAIPVLLRIANYGRAFEQDTSLHLIDYIENELTPKSEFGLFLRRAIEQGRCLVILDGLDEIADRKLRIRVTERIQSMVASYHQNRFIVTSRPIGYDLSPLTREFKHATLQDLRKDDKEHFVKLWYEALNVEISSSVHQNGADDLIQALRNKPQISRLAANPLLLTIMVLMHWRGVKLPSRRVQIYENATDTLIEYWTSQREGVDLDAEEVKRILAPIAHHILSSSVSGVISQYNLLPLFYKGITDQRGSDQSAAKRMGRELLRTLGEQSGIFLERGFDADSNPVYGFLHQTFGEYLAALYVANEMLSGTFDLRKYIHRPMWHEPFLLFAGHLSLVSPTHANLLLRQILDFEGPFEQTLQRNVILAAECLADDIQIKPEIRDEVLTKLANLLLSKMPQVRYEAVQNYHRLAATRHIEITCQILKTTLERIEDMDKVDAEIRYNIAEALIHIGELDTAKIYLWPLENEKYQYDIIRRRVMHHRFKYWPDQASSYLCQLYDDKNIFFAIKAAINLNEFLLGPINANTAKEVLGESGLLDLIESLIEKSRDEKDRANLCLLKTIVPEQYDYQALRMLLVAEIPAETQCLAAIKLLESEFRTDAIAKLTTFTATEPEQAPRAAQALMSIDEKVELSWQLLRDTALIGDDENSTQAIVTLLKAGDDHFAVPSALHLLSLYPPQTLNFREIKLWPVVEALIESKHKQLGLDAARWLALRPGYSHRLQACEALLEAGRVEPTIPLLQYLTYESHDESSQKACQRLLILKEIDRVLPMLAQLVESDSAEMCYHACLGLALAEGIPENCQKVAQTKLDLKLSILNKRLQLYQAAVKDFCKSGLDALANNKNLVGNIQSYQEISRLAFNLFTETVCLYDSDKPEIIGKLLECSVPVVVVNSALFDLRAGRFERMHKRLVTLLKNHRHEISLPVHLQALRTLGQIVNAETAELLTQALQSENSRIRECAANALGPLGNPDTVQPLIVALKDPNRNVRIAAARALGQLGKSDAVQHLISALEDSDNELRSTAARSLGELADLKASHPLIKAIKDEYDSLRGAAASSLGRLGNNKVIEHLLDALKDKKSNVRWCAAQALREFNDPRILESLIALLKDENATVRWVAAQELGNLRCPDAIQPLLSLFSDSDQVVQRIAAWSLSRIADNDLIMNKLIEAIENPENNTRIPAAFCLGNMGNSAAIQALIEALNSDYKQVRTGSVWAFWQQKDEKKSNILTTALYDDFLTVRNIAALGLVEIKNKAFLPHLLSILMDEYAFVREHVAFAIGAQHEARLMKHLFAMNLNKENLRRLPLFESISRLGLKEYVPFLIATSTANHSYLAQAYAKALIHLDPQSAIPVLDRYEKQFPRESHLKLLYGQAMWELGHIKAAHTNFLKAVEYKRDKSVLLALSLFHIEHDEFKKANDYVEQAYKDGRCCGKIDYLTHGAVIEWLTDKRKSGINKLKQALDRDANCINIDDLKYHSFWREKAVTALEAMLTELQNQGIEAK